MKQSLSFAMCKMVWVPGRRADAGSGAPADGEGVAARRHGDASAGESAAELTCCVTGRGFPAAADTLDGLFMPTTRSTAAIRARSSKDAHTRRARSLRSAVLAADRAQGGGCQNALGWYNATDPATAPAANQIYSSFRRTCSSRRPTGSPARDTDFCPLAIAPRRSRRRSTPGRTRCPTSRPTSATMRTGPAASRLRVDRQTDNGTVSPDQVFAGRAQRALDRRCPTKALPGSPRSSTSRPPIRTATTSRSRINRLHRQLARLQPGSTGVQAATGATTATSTTSSFTSAASIARAADRPATRWCRASAPAAPPSARTAG